MKITQPSPHESDEQINLFRWTAYMQCAHPDLELLYHIPNGGKRDKATAGRLKAEGVKAGVPDLCLPVPKNSYHGLYIELKVSKNKPSDLQNKWIDNLTKQGYQVNVCYGWESAAQVILNYLGIQRQSLYCP